MTISWISSVSRKNEMMVAGQMIQTDVEESDKAMFKHAGQWFARKTCDN